MPGTTFDFPAMKAVAPRRLVKYTPVPLSTAGAISRMKVYLMSFGVIGWPSENRAPGRSVKVYCSPLSLTTGRLAVPGTSVVPAVPGWSAYRTSVVHSAFARPQVTAKYHRLGSRLSIAPDDIAPISVPAAPAASAPPDPVEGKLLPLLLDEQAAISRAAAAPSASRPVSWRRVLLLAITFSDLLASGCLSHAPSCQSAFGLVVVTC